MAKLGTVTHNSTESFFGGGMGMIIPMRRRPAVVDGKNADNQSSKSTVVHPVVDSDNKEK